MFLYFFFFLICTSVSFRVHQCNIPGLRERKKNSPISKRNRQNFAIFTSKCGKFFYFCGQMFIFLWQNLAKFGFSNGNFHGARLSNDPYRSVFVRNKSSLFFAFKWVHFISMLTVATISIRLLVTITIKDFLNATVIN